MSTFPYALQSQTLPRLGLIVLQVDETIEQDFRRLFAPQVAQIYVSRIPSGAELTPDSIARMETALPCAAGLLPSAQQFDVVGYACTSGTTLIGAARVHELVSQATHTRAVTDPLTATLTHCQTLGLQRIGIVSPYIASVAGPIRAAFEMAGIIVPDTLSFGEEIEQRVARIAPDSLADAARTLARRTSHVAGRDIPVLHQSAHARHPRAARPRAWPAGAQLKSVPCMAYGDAVGGGTASECGTQTTTSLSQTDGLGMRRCSLTKAAFIPAALFGVRTCRCSNPNGRYGPVSFLRK